MSFVHSPIVSIQTAVVTIPGSSVTATATLSPAITNTANAMIFYEGTTGTTESGTLFRRLSGDGTAIAVLTNATTVTATRITGSADPLSCFVRVVEFKGSFVKSSGSGTVTVLDANTFGQTTISPAVVITKTLLVPTGFTILTDSISPEYNGVVGFANTATVEFDRLQSSVDSSGLVVGFNYIEFK